ncbi:heme lyase CcmF/NrfE family subunit [Panacagrimonas sp.]|uniref:heme lyase CcmF/NrfE family subunit n=1 Tax=Panacagrimonas sp. TaxID=2480088 RepID=UPI003B52F055
MIAEYGHYALWLALAVALAQTFVPVVGYARGDARWMGLGASAAQAQFGLVVVSYLCLSQAFWVNDFSVAYVASNSHSELPLMYRLSAVWGAHEGSLLLWMLMLAGWGAAVSVFNRRLPSEVSSLVLATLGAVGVGFLLFMLLTSNPFDRVFPVPAEGRDLNPLLQDPGLIIHPPMLYMGYVGFSVAFAFAIAALVTGRLDAAWARWARPWTTTAWLFLTMGITLGSWWAYNELGWGGWWFWDPVENASFMPWLVGTALIHSLAVTEKRGLLQSWTLLLSILVFSLSLLGTFLVRSGVLVSVHAFATDPARGVYILMFLAVVVGGSLVLYAIRAPRLVQQGQMELASREGLLLLNNVFLVVAAAAVLVGTLYPLAAQVFGYKMSVGPPYFNAVFLPLMAPLAVLVGMAGVVSWKRARLGPALRPLRPWAIAALALGLALPWITQREWSWGAAAGGVLAIWVLTTSVQEVWRRARARNSLMQGLRSVPRGAWGMTMAHFGLGLWTLGVAFTSTFSVETDVRLGPGQSASIGRYEFRFDGVTHVDGANYQSDTAAVAVLRSGREIARLSPEKRLYPSQGSVMTEAAVDANLLRDLYVAMGEPIDKNDVNGDWALRLYYKPMMRLVWLGGVLMFFGGILAASDRRYRLEQRRTAADLPPAAAVA